MTGSHLRDSRLKEGRWPGPGSQVLIKREPWNTGAAASTEVALEVAVCESSEFKLKCWGGGGYQRREACQGEAQSWAQGAGLRYPGTHICGREKEMEFYFSALSLFSGRGDVRGEAGCRARPDFQRAPRRMVPWRAQDWNMARHQGAGSC